MIKIGIIGPESTGKSELAKQLATLFNCPWESEYARTYIQNLSVEYTYANVVAIAQYQIEQEEKIQLSTPANGLVFFDTELIITKVWFEHVYGKCPALVNDYLQNNPMDFYLLCKPDLPWIADSVRENGHLRQFFFDWYKREIEQLGIPYSIVEGINNARWQCAQQAIVSFLPETFFKGIINNTVL